MKSFASASILTALSICLSVSSTLADAVSDARVITSASDDCAGGMCVVLGDDISELAVAISRQGCFVVQALVPDRAALDKARAAVRSSGKYGPVSVDCSTYGYLPYAENLINLIVVDDYAGVAAKGLAVDEVFRVLAPLGVAYFGRAESLTAKLAESGFAASRAGAWVKAVKPWPKEIDEWTHNLHDADGNPVANDSVVAPPKHYQWISGPTWLRSHESDSSVRTIVTSRGRLFYIADEAPIGLPGDHDLPDKWFLIARDAFNGVPLWKVPIQDWGWRAWKPSWFTPRPGGIPLNIEKRLVAVDDKVYVTLGYHAPVSEVNAKTGKVLRTYDGTAETAEILYRDGLLILTVLEDDRARVKVVDAKSGKTLWTSKDTYGGTTTDYYRFTAMRGSVPAAKVDPTLNTATDGDVVALLDGEDVVCLDYKSGHERWRSRFPLVEADYKAG
ncbi:MAG: outer membrane protein assembly factor BamB family protein, partial [Planctomycetota bacterium]